LGSGWRSTTRPGTVPLCNAVNRRLGDTGPAGDLTRRRVPVLILTPPLLTTGDWAAALAGFLAIGISLSGALAFGAAGGVRI
jgi:hypothetical protein